MKKKMMWIISLMMLGLTFSPLLHATHGADSSGGGGVSIPYTFRVQIIYIDYLSREIA